MNTPLFMIGVSNMVAAMLCIGVSIPLLKCRIKRNRWYGMRIRKAFVSEENWKKINEYGARAIIRWSMPLLGMGLILSIAAFFISLRQAQNITWFLAPTLLSVFFILGAIVQTWIWSRHLPDKQTMMLAEIMTSTQTVYKTGIGFGSVIAIVCSWQRNRSILWAILAGIFSWFYVIYFALTRRLDETKL